MAELQVIPARHGTATFVPAGQVIKIVNTSGHQVIDTWAFALPKPEPKNSGQQQKQDDGGERGAKQNTAAKQQPPVKKAKKSADLPSQEEAEKATKQGWKEGEEAHEDEGQKKSTWGSYVPTSIIPSFGSKQTTSEENKDDSEQKKNSRTWASYFPSGKGFSNYIPESARKTASDTVSGFAKMHARDPNQTYMEQLQQFSKTPVGAAGWSGFAALTGSGWAGSSFAGYQAWNAANAADAAPTEFLSLSHTRAATLHLSPKVDDTLVSNFREPVLTLIEDTSAGIHDTLIAACDPARYKGLGVEDWEEHGSCAENLVLALEELNKRAGLKGAKGVGADITVNSVPPPLNLFMNIPWTDAGDLAFRAPRGKKNEYVRFRAERDVVIVMSACPQDILEINGKEVSDAHFVVEGEEDIPSAMKRASSLKKKNASKSNGNVVKRPPPRKITSSHATSTAGTETAAPAPLKRRVPPLQQRKATAAAPQGPSAAPTQSSSTGGTASAGQAPRKKPIPAPVAPQKKVSPAAASGGDASSTAVPEKKKPRKLNPRPNANA